jgi:hypothetical protein
VFSYIVEAGASSGAANLAVIDTGTTATTFSANAVAGGRYLVRVKARNSVGAGPSSNEIGLVVGTAAASPADARR